MVNENELRIGNYYFGNGRTFRLDTKMMYAFMSFKEPYTLENIEPIELSSEILEACGFDRTSIAYYYNDNISISYANSGLHEYVVNIHGFWPKIKYLHQLQNLYFALTNLDLTIKFPELV